MLATIMYGLGQNNWGRLIQWRATKRKNDNGLGQI